MNPGEVRAHPSVGLGLGAALSAAFTMIAVGAAGPAWAGPTTFEVDDRHPLAFVLSTPTGRPSRIGSSALIRRIDRRVRRDTSLDLQPLTGDLVKQCRGRLGCLALKARPDYDATALDGPGGRRLPYREHVRRLKRRDQPYARYLLVVSNVTLPERADRLSAVLVDTDIALQLYHDSRRDHPEWEDRFEARVDSGAVAGHNMTAAVRTAEDIDAFLGAFFGRNVRPRLEATGHWRPFGTVRVEAPVRHAAIVWNGRTVGSTGPGATFLTQARSGQHVLTLQHPDYLEATYPVAVTAGQTTVVSAELQIKPTAEPASRQVLLWSGVGLVAAGGALGVYALTRQDGAATTVCVGDTCEGSRRFQTFGYDPEVDAGSPINPSGVLVAPLAYSLAITGATWSIGTLLSDDDEFPWLPLLLGLAAGGASYGLSAALDGG